MDAAAPTLLTEEVIGWLVAVSLPFILYKTHIISRHVLMGKICTCKFHWANMECN